MPSRRQSPSRQKTSRQRTPVLAPQAARSLSPANPCLESPADSVTRAPNLIKLGQAVRARQDLVRKSKSSTKCGDSGENRAGDGQVSEIRRESGRASRRSPVHTVEFPASGRCSAGPPLPESASPIARDVGDGHGLVTPVSRIDGPFRTILSETARQTGTSSPQPAKGQAKPLRPWRDSRCACCARIEGAIFRSGEGIDGLRGAHRAAPISEVSN
jgi:hypothetical protein